MRKRTHQLPEEWCLAYFWGTSALVDSVQVVFQIALRSQRRKREIDYDYSEYIEEYDYSKQEEAESTERNYHLSYPTADIFGSKLRLGKWKTWSLSEISFQVIFSMAWAQDRMKTTRRSSKKLKSLCFNILLPMQLRLRWSSCGNGN